MTSPFHIGLNEDDTFTATYAYNTNYPGSYLEIPEEYQDCKCFEVKAINKQGERIIGTQMSVQDSDGKGIGEAQYPGNWCDYTATFNIPSDKTAAKIIINPQGPYEETKDKTDEEGNVIKDANGNPVKEIVFTDQSDKAHTIYYVKARYK